MAGRLRAILEHVYLTAVSFFLLWNIPYMTEAQWTFELREHFPGVWLGLAAAALLLQGCRPGPCGWLLAFPAWMTVTSAYRGAAVLDEQTEMILRAVMAFGVILPAARAVRFERLMKYVKAVLALWTAAFTLQAAVGLWAALTGHAVFSLKGAWYIGMNLGDHRLYLNAYVTTGAAKLGLSVLLAAVGMAMSKAHLSRLAYVLGGLVQLICLSLTDCRTAFLAVGAGLGMALAILLLRKGKCPGWLRTCAALMAVPVMALAAYGGLSGLLNALAPHIPLELDNLTMLELPAHLLPDAAAEGPAIAEAPAEAPAESSAESPAVQHRALETGNLFNDRQLIWSAALKLLTHEPRFLLTGATTALAPLLTNAYLPEAFSGRAFYHVHNIYLQTLVSWGIPGLTLLCAFLFIFLRAAWRVTLRHALPLWQKWVPLPVFYVLICEMVDCFTRLSEESPLLLFGCFFAGLTLVIDARARREALSRAPLSEAAEVVIPVYNGAAWVERAAASALATPNARLILVDDGSTDGAAAICDRLAQDPRVRVIHQPNRGVSAARNAGLMAATAKYVAFLDADDVLLPGALAALMARMGAAEAIQGGVRRNAEEAADGPSVPRAADAEILPAREALRRALGNPTRHLLCHGWLFRREALTERFNEALTLGEDGEWLLRVLSGMEQAAFCDIPAYGYTLRKGSALHGGQDVADKYLRTLDCAAPALAALQMPEEAALYRLTHILLAVTHGEASDIALWERPAVREDLARARLKGLSPRMLALRLARARAYPLLRGAVALRRAWNWACRTE